MYKKFFFIHCFLLILSQFWFYVSPTQDLCDAVWAPPKIPRDCPSNLSSCTLLGYFYLDLLSSLYTEPLYKGPEDVVVGPYDFVIVGAGASGSVVASRLSEVSDWKVLLLEAGPEQPEVTLIPGTTGALYGSNLDYQYVAQPDGKNCLARPGKACNWPRGRGLGGSTIINSNLYIRGNKQDFDQWAAEGNDGWSYDHVLPYFKKSENNLNIEELDTEYHGVGGPLAVSNYPYQDLTTNLTIQAFLEKGLPLTDFNGGHQYGVGNCQTTSKNGVRASTYTSFILPHRSKRKNLTVLPNAKVIKVHFSDEFGILRAYGVTYIRNNLKYKINATKKVILSAGTIDTPKLLMLSGVGPKDHLNELNISLVKNLPVGANLQEHVTFNALAFTLSKETSTRVLGGEILEEVFDYPVEKPNLLSYDGTVTVMAYYKTNESLPAPDVKFEFGPLYVDEFLSDPIWYDRVKFLPTAFYDGLLVRPMTIKPKSRGHLRLKSSDPLSSPLIYPSYYQHPHDMSTLLKGIRFLLTIEDTKVFKENGWKFVKKGFSKCDNLKWGSDDYLECLARQYTATSYHPVGTCKMGPDNDIDAVVDPKLNVRGVKGLKVVDASVMPEIPRGNTNAACIMIGEKAADIIKEEFKVFVTN